uniref:Uncharacterized protein n=1 Tax=Daucus carota subsp. sativus TaxID=79200 RepID=A0A166CT15_DAUCS
MVVIAQPFGRVFELWSLEMGLGPMEPQFMAVNEADLGPEVVNEGEVNEDDENEEMAVAGAGGLALAGEADHEVIELLD